jgi:uncharacterized protein
MALTHLLYLHGFRSSPQSTKARQMQRWVARHQPALHWQCPQLDISPREAMRAVFGLIASWPRDTMAVLGSSLGGFYATLVAECTGCKAVLLNPAVEPARDLLRHIGETTAWHSGDTLEFRSEFVDELRSLHPRVLTQPQRYFCIIAKGDEVLDWREMSERYAGSRQRVLDGGDHALSDFESHLPEIAVFLGLQR